MAGQACAEFRGERSGEAPLTWGQGGMWRAIRRNAPGHFNIGRLLDVPEPGPGVADAAGAVGQLLARHESLRTRIRTVDGVPAQVVDGAGWLPIQVAESGPDPSATANLLLGHLVKAGFDEPNEFPLRVCLVTIGGRVRAVALVFHHVAADWPATEIVVRDLRLLLDGGTSLAAPGLQPRDLAARQRGPDAHLSRRAVRYWTAAARRIPPRMFEFTGSPHQPVHQEAALHSRAARAAALLIAARRGVSTSTVILAATAALAGVWTGHPTAALSVVSGNRFRADLARMVTVLSQLGLFVLDVGDRPDFAELVRRAAPAALRAYWHAQYEQAALDRAIDGVSRARGTEVNPYGCFNDLRAADDAAEVAGAAADETAVRAACADTTLTWTAYPEYIRCRFCLGVRDRPDDVLGNAAEFGPGGRTGVLRISLRADTRCLPPSQIEGFLRQLERLLVDAAFGEVRLPPLRARRTPIGPGVA